MKFSITIVAFNIMAVLAAPPLNPRQNDVPDCENGGHAEHLKTYDSAHFFTTTTTTKLNSGLLDKMLLQLPVITTLLSLVSAQSIGGLGNVTVSFFTSDQDCESSDKKTPILTTRDIPTELICFNLTDTFSPGNKTISGYQKALEPWEHPNSNISFHLQQNDFDSSANYTQIRYELPGSEAGEKSSWVLWVYPHLNCETEVKGIDNHEYPWYEVDCQTEKGGECQEVSYPIKSFAILNGDRDGECKTWAQLGAATRMNSQMPGLFYTTVAMAVAILAL
ncbi:unnamed protein product [Fusarium graminearum]|nr:unnamed protein product [Fusarium graminearum]